MGLWTVAFGWNIQLSNELLAPCDVRQICSIPVSSFHMEDHLILRFPRSRYQIARRHDSWSHKIWCLVTRETYESFVFNWRSKFSVGDSYKIFYLSKITSKEKGMKISKECIICLAFEDDAYISFNCSFVLDYWQEFSLNL